MGKKFENFGFGVVVVLTLVVASTVVDFRVVVEGGGVVVEVGGVESNMVSVRRADSVVVRFEVLEIKVIRLRGIDVVVLRLIRGVEVEFEYNVVKFMLYVVISGGRGVVVLEIFNMAVAPPVMLNPKIK